MIKNNNADEVAWSAIRQYQTLYPKAQRLEDFVETYGPTGLAELIRKAAGRQIVIRYEDLTQSDKLLHSFI